MIKSLHARGHDFASKEKQIEVLEHGVFDAGELPRFENKLKSAGFFPLTPSSIEIFQVNVGYMCNQVCKHCHVDAGPDRVEVMTPETMEYCLEVLSKHHIPTLDVTGGAPEMNPHFRWFVERASQAGLKEIIVRSNLTIMLANPKYHDLPDFFRMHNVRVCSSLPFYQPDKTDRQRGDGVFMKSIEALKRLNNAGYGNKDSGLILDLVYNPSGAFLPADQSELEQTFKQQLFDHYGIVFNRLFTITNIPISRFLDYLISSGNYEEYMEKLVLAFNPLAVEGVMCRNTISVDWEGNLYDCDFNQMLGLKTAPEASQHVRDFDLARLEARRIVVGEHCYACTAGAGSSCQGSTA